MGGVVIRVLAIKRSCVQMKKKEDKYMSNVREINAIVITVVIAVAFTTHLVCGPSVPFYNPNTSINASRICQVVYVLSCMC